MAKNTNEKLNIQEAIKAFSKDDISTAGINLFSVLGYDTSLQAPLDNKTYSEFKENYIDSSPAADRFSEEKALTEQWESIDILFQLTDDSFSGTKSLFEESVNPTDIQSYLCFAIELKGNEYSKTQIAGITREVNKLFSIPIIIIFKYGECITLSIINRRVNKRDSERDVLEKVTLIKDILYEKPHRAHVEILFDMSLAQLNKNYTINNFESLHKAWSEVLDTQTLNKRFYAELSNWYFWAIKTVVYPGADVKADKNYLFVFPDRLIEHNAKNLIRLLTRLLFVWFIKEKELIPEELFDENIIKDIITLFEPEKYYLFNTDESVESKSIYYKAILQNLFFASLNAEQGKRAFRIDGQNQNATSLMRYKRYHKNPEDFVKLIESKVPFMNGGLFECLDHQDDVLKGKNGGALINYEDGFSDRKDNELFVPDYVFFGKDVKVDLSSEYDDKRKKDVTVNGIINILQKYKFTIAENTPVEEDIALDPELLGRVFENLLASYNPETKTNARKQTGSFYTPRPIVEYMVDESLKAYLKTKIASATLSNHNDEDRSLSAVEGNEIDKKLDNLISYNESEPEFTEEERFQILKYIDECKILDPACGSGAFPMGILQKMVYVIHKLDPQNDNWKLLQIEKIMTASNISSKEKNDMIAEISSIFDDNDLDYARKLYLIENCIHGIDIQPIATQISRLRFFISLIVDQKVDSTKPNFGVRPLPNLENRFVTANSLIGLNEDTKTLFDKNIELLMERLQKVRHKLFNAKSPKYKFELRQEDKVIRTELEAELVKNGFGKENAKLISTWDPYDKNKTAEFFDAEWMFGIKDGFDIVIANPPYIEFKKQSQELKDSLKQYETAKGKFDVFVCFIEKSAKILKQGGVHCFINPTTFMKRDYGKATREYTNKYFEILQILDFADAQIFDSATTYTGIFLFKKNDASRKYTFSYQKFLSNKDVDDDNMFIPINTKYKESFRVDNSELKKDSWIFLSSLIQDLYFKIDNPNATKMKDIAKYIFVGIQSGKDDVFFINQTIIDQLKLETQIIHPILKGNNVESFFYDWSGTYIIYPYDKDNKVIKESVLENEYPNVYKYLVSQKNNLSGRDYFDNSSKEWYELWCERSYIKFCQKKIVNCEISADNRFAVDENNYLGNTKIFNTVLNDKYSHLYDYITGLLNSNVLNYFEKQIATPKAGGAYEHKTQFIERYPIMLGTEMQQKEIGNLSSEIAKIKKDDINADVSKLVKQLNEKVYKLYGLTEEEIAIIEGR